MHGQRVEHVICGTSRSRTDHLWTESRKVVYGKGVDMMAYIYLHRSK